MPNALAHFGVQGLVSRGLWREGDARWIYLGCILPDVAWVLHRITRATLAGSVDLLDLRLYAMIQASLLFSVVLAAACAALTSQARRVFILLLFNCTLHLLLDACQTKWGNGVHLFAPYSWELTNFGFFWPDSWPTYVLTIGGLAIIAWEFRRPRGLLVPMRPTGKRLAASALLVALYLVAPVYFFEPAELSDSHSIRTLRRTAHRMPRSVAFDRNEYVHTDQGTFLRAWNGEVLQLHFDLYESTALPDHNAEVSLWGWFWGTSSVKVHGLHVHTGPSRDWPTYVGFLLLLVIWVRSFALRK
ncbi:MAG: hypothetical protein V3T86_08565 [Planctomycetota bacterium]